MKNEHKTYFFSNVSSTENKNSIKYILESCIHTFLQEECKHIFTIHKFVLIPIIHDLICSYVQQSTYLQQVISCISLQYLYQPNIVELVIYELSHSPFQHKINFHLVQQEIEQITQLIRVIIHLCIQLGEQQLLSKQKI